MIYGDRTGGVPAGLKYLEQAVVDTNLLDPDLVMTVGDLVQGYNRTPEWLEQAEEFRDIMDGLDMAWFPVAGNHDVYWAQRDKTKPAGQHEANYEKHFGPLWYSFEHKNAGFVVLYTDEGDQDTNEKGFREGRLQQMSPEQLDFLALALKSLEDKDHVFVFLHHPRWIGGGYTGSNWEAVHKRLKDAGNVSAVFAGHIHQMRFDGEVDGIKYYALATTGGALQADIPEAGLLHHMNVVTVRPDSYSVSAIPVGGVMDPERFTPEFLRQITSARSLTAKRTGDFLRLGLDGSVSGDYEFSLSNPTDSSLEVTVIPSAESGDWTFTPDHLHCTLQPGEQATKAFSAVKRSNGDLEDFLTPVLRMKVDYLGENFRVELPERSVAMDMSLAQISDDVFASDEGNSLQLSNPEATQSGNSIRIPSEQIALPDGPFTLEAWINPSRLDQSRGIAAKTQSSEYALFLQDGAPQFDVRLGTASTSRYVNARNPGQIAANKWCHVAGVYDGSEVRLYVDGKQVAQSKGSGPRVPNALSLYIGADPDGRDNATRGFDGKIDEFRLSRGVRYTDDFNPDKRHSRDDETILLLHFDERFGPFVLNDSEREALPSATGDIQIEPSGR
jgi:hypothetical protein